MHNFFFSKKNKKLAPLFFPSILHPAVVHSRALIKDKGFLNYIYCYEMSYIILTTGFLFDTIV